MKCRGVINCHWVDFALINQCDVVSPTRFFQPAFFLIKKKRKKKPTVRQKWLFYRGMNFCFWWLLWLLFMKRISHSDSSVDQPYSLVSTCRSLCFSSPLPCSDPEMFTTRCKYYFENCTNCLTNFPHFLDLFPMFWVPCWTHSWELNGTSVIKKISSRMVRLLLPIIKVL